MLRDLLHKDVHYSSAYAFNKVYVTFNDLSDVRSGHTMDEAGCGAEA